MVCFVKVSQADQVRREFLGYQGLQESMVLRVDLVSNRTGSVKVPQRIMQSSLTVVY